MIDDLGRSPHAIAVPSERSFGLFFGMFFALLAAWFWYSGKTVWAAGSLAAAVLLTIIAIIAPRMLTCLNRAWFQVGMLLNAVVGPLVLGAIFFLLITPIAMALRLSGRDALCRRYDKSLDSYWIERTPPGPRPESFKNQF